MPIRLILILKKLLLNYSSLANTAQRIRKNNGITYPIFGAKKNNLDISLMIKITCLNLNNLFFQQIKELNVFP